MGFRKVVPDLTLVVAYVEILFFVVKCKIVVISYIFKDKIGNLALFL